MSVHMFMEHMKTMRHRLQHKLLYIEIKLPEYFRASNFGDKNIKICVSIRKSNVDDTSCYERQYSWPNLVPKKKWVVGWCDGSG